MSAETIRKMVQEAEVESGEVYQIVCSAANNAGQTLIDQGRKDARFVGVGIDYSDEMLALIEENVVCILSDRTVADDTAKFFAARGIRA